jgi:hypothetical protein
MSDRRHGPRTDERKVDMERRARHLSADEAAAQVRSGDWIDYGTTVVQPDAFDAALGRRLAVEPELGDLRFRSCITMRPRAVLEADPTGERVTWFSWHFSGYDRKMHDAGVAHYQPSSIGEIPDCYRRFLPAPDVVVLKCRPMDADGWFNMSAANLWHRAVVESARTVVMERRIYGLENEYGVTCTLRGQRRLSPDEVARYLFRAGGVVGAQLSNVFLAERRAAVPRRRLAPRVRHPECDSLYDLVVHDKAGERILEQLLVSAEQRLREEGIRGDIYLFKNNTDSAGNSYGCHENYLTSRADDSVPTPRCSSRSS